MLDCNELDRISAGFLYDAIPDNVKSLADEHLCRCRICGFLIKQMQIMRKGLKKLLLSERCPDSIKENIFRALDR